MSFRAILVMMVVIGLAPGLLLGAMYNPTRWLRWRTADLYGLHFSITLALAWTLWRQWVNRRVPSEWPGVDQVVITVIVFALIDFFVWLRLVRYILHRRHLAEDGNEEVEW